MPMCTERSKAHLIITTDCTASYSARNDSKDVD